jgi:hypothetical protein
MKRLFVFLILAGLAYGGWVMYRSLGQSTPKLGTMSTGGSVVKLSGPLYNLDEAATVLGASITNMVENGQEYLATVTDGKSEPIVNQLISKTQETLKDLPQKEAEKIKYEFCKGVVTEYENKSKGAQ